MKILLTEIQREWSHRLYHMVIFAVLFILIGTFVPKFYYQYVDNKPYLTIVQPITYDKKSYNTCEPTVSVIHYRALIDLPVETRVRVYKVVDSGVEQVGKEYTSKTFVNKTGIQGQNLVQKGRIPCNFETGSYFYQGLILYDIKGVQHNYPIVSTQLNITKK